VPDAPWSMMPHDVLAFWGLDCQTKQVPVAEGTASAWLVVVPDGRRYVLKHKPAEADVALEGWLLGQLADRGLPVAPPIPTTAGALCAPEAGIRYALYRYLPGAALHAHYAPGAEHRARAFGRAIAQLHRGLLDITPVAGLPIMSLPLQLLGGVRSAVYAHASRSTAVDPTVLDATFGVLENELLPQYARLPQQLIHRDCHPGNMLFERNEVSGFIDFEIATWGIRIFDLAYCSTAMLSAAEEDSQRREDWVALLEALVAGYRDTQPLQPAELAHIWHVQLSIQLLFVSYFAGHEQLDLADANYRTLQWLLTRRDAIQRTLERIR